MDTPSRKRFVLAGSVVGVLLAGLLVVLARSSGHDATVVPNLPVSVEEDREPPQGESAPQRRQPATQDRASHSSGRLRRAAVDQAGEAVLPESDTEQAKKKLTSRRKNTRKKRRDDAEEGDAAQAPASQKPSKPSMKPIRMPGG